MLEQQECVDKLFDLNTKRDFCIYVYTYKRIYETTITNDIGYNF